MAVLAGKVNNLMGQVASLWCHIGNLYDDICTEDIESPLDILLDSEMEAWKVSCAEFHDLEGVNSEALWWVMGFRLDCEHSTAETRGAVGAREGRSSGSL